MMGLPSFPSSFLGYSYLIMKLGPLQLTRKGLSVASTAACLTFMVIISVSPTFSIFFPVPLFFLIVFTFEVWYHTKCLYFTVFLYIRKIKLVSSAWVVRIICWNFLQGRFIAIMIINFLSFVFFSSLKDPSKCKPLPNNHTTRATSICFKVVLDPSDICWCAGGWNYSDPVTLLEVHPYSFWWGKAATLSRIKFLLCNHDFCFGFLQVRNVALGIVSRRINWLQLTMMETIDSKDEIANIYVITLVIATWDLLFSASCLLAP